MMYAERAEVYDRIYSFKDYKAEAEALHQLLADNQVADGATLLEAACGTGSYLQQLSRWYRVSGFDISPQMLSIARRKLSNVVLFEADMASFELKQPVDVIVCLFSSIGYLRPEARLSSAARAFARALKPGGLALVEPWLEPEGFRPGIAHMHTYESDELKLCRANVGKLDGVDAVLDFHWLAARAGKDVEYFTERHVLRCYTREQMLEAFGQAGLEVSYLEDYPRGLYLARRR
jgi:daunosaminyl-N,N-dimethyltransferase/N-dimethyltransferase